MDFVMSGDPVVKCRVLRQENIYRDRHIYTTFEPAGISDYPTIVIIPGALQNSQKHEYVGFRLACQNTRVVFAPVSLLRTDIRDSFDELVIQTMDFLDHIRKKHGEVKSVAGHSLGGLIAIRMALLDSKSAY
jgi:alpha-beta hydrolase superfamily lysophospholipase